MTSNFFPLFRFALGLSFLPVGSHLVLLSVRVAAGGNDTYKSKIALPYVPEYMSRAARHTGPVAVFEIVMLAVNLDFAVAAEGYQKMFPVVRVPGYRLPLRQDEMPGAEIIPAVLCPEDVPLDNSGRERRSVERLDIRDFSPVFSLHANSPSLKNLPQSIFINYIRKNFPGL